MIRCAVVCCVLLWCARYNDGCEFPDFNFSMTSVKNTTGEWIVKVNLDHDRGRQWDVYINKTSDTSKCHESILLVVRRADNSTQEEDIPPGYCLVPHHSNPTKPSVKSAKNAPLETSFNPLQMLQKPPRRNPKPKKPTTVPTTPLPTVFPTTTPSSGQVPVSENIPGQYPPPLVQQPQDRNYQGPPIGHSGLGSNLSQTLPPGYPYIPPPSGQKPKNSSTVTPSQPVTPVPPTHPGTPPKPPPRDYRYLRNHNYYKIHKYSKFTWFEARDACQAEGTHLAVINSENEAQALGTLIVREGTRNWDHWVGFHGLEDQDWLSIYNETLKVTGYEKWWPGQPDYAPGYAQCGIFKYRSSTDMGFLDLACRYDAVFICEHDGK